MSLFTPTALGRQPLLVEDIMADTQSFAADIDKVLRRQGDAQPAVIKSIEPDIEDSSQWRFHVRGRGILVAIPVKRNLLYAEKYSSEAAIVDVIERLIRQRDLSGRIEVVLIEPASLDCYIRTAQPRRSFGGDVNSPCNCE
jgi:hypothetical protein